jgi:urate oxidase
MAIVLGPTQYGKAETRVVRIFRDTERHELRDLNVSTALRGDFDAAHLTGDQGSVLPTDSQKNTCFAFAKSHATGAIENYSIALAEHFVADIPSVHRARVDVEEYAWERVSVGGAGHAHTFVRTGAGVRTVAVVVSDGQGPLEENGLWIISGLKDLVVLKSTGSEFAGFYQDEYTTLPETSDRVLATSLTAGWRYASREVAWDAAFAQVKQVLLEQFAVVHSYALQQTLFEMGSAVLAAREDIVEIRLSAPNKHHFLVDLAPFGLDNPGEVFYAADRPYGLIQCAVRRDDAPPCGPAWESPACFA